MKKIISASVLFCCSLLSFGTTRFVDNANSAPTIYSTIQAAVDASAANDTIYIQASLFQYQAVTLDKPLVLIGEGALPNQQQQRTCKVSVVTLAYNSDFSSSASGSRIYGLHIVSLNMNMGSSSVYCTCTPPGQSIIPYAISNLILERNYLENVTLGNGATFNLLFHQNVIRSLTGGSSYYNAVFNSNFTNNIIMSYFSIGNVDYGTGNNFSHNTCYLSNFRFPGANVIDNLFDRHNASYPSDSFVTQNSHAYFHRNVFAYPLSTYIGNTTFGENLYTDQGQVIQGKPNGSEIITTTYWAPGPFWNLHLNATAIGVAYASDGTEVGIYGGTDPWIDEVSTDDRFRYFAAPRQWPVLKEVNILNPNTTSNGTLNIQIKAKSQN